MGYQYGKDTNLPGMQDGFYNYTADGPFENEKSTKRLLYSIAALAVAGIIYFACLNSAALPIIIIVLVLIVVLIIVLVIEQNKKENMSFAERADLELGLLNPKLICPHCQTTGEIRTKPIVKKGGIDGSKAAAAVVTGGWSVLATGLALKESSHTQAHCMNCGSTWQF
jgi:hypothetical protein